MKTIETSKNKAETLYALVELENGNGLVYVKKHQYCSHARMGFSTKWYCCTLTQKQNHTDFQLMAREGLPMIEAKAFFTKKINGKAKG